MNSNYVGSINYDGGRYTGKIENKKPDGYGVCIYASGDKSEGCWKNGKMDGYGAHTFSNGDKYVGQWLAGNQHGTGTYTFSAGDEYVGQWLDGKKHGTGTYTFSTGDKYVGQWKNGKQHGDGTYTFSTGDEYVGQWQDDKKHGIGTFTFSAGDEYVGQWQNDKRHGTGTYTFSNGDKYVGQWQNGKKHRTGTFNYQNGNKYEGQWQDDKKQGTGTFTYTTFFKTEEKFSGKILEDRMISVDKAEESGFLKLAAALNYEILPSAGSQSAIAINWLKNRFEDQKDLEFHKIFLKTKESVNQVTHAEQIDNSILDDLVKKSLHIPQIIMGGTKGHAVAFVLYKENFLICNKGLGTPVNPENPRVKAVTHLILKSPYAKKEALSQIGKIILMEDSIGINSIYKGLPKLSEGNPVRTFDSFQPVKQRTGNCWYASAHCAIRAVMWLLAQKELRGRLKVTSVKNIKDSIEEIYKKTISAEIIVKETIKEIVNNEKAKNPDYNILEDIRFIKLTSPRREKGNKILRIIKEVSESEKQKTNQSQYSPSQHAPAVVRQNSFGFANFFKKREINGPKI